MLGHITKCDCSFCMPPFELLNSTAARGNWSTKEDLVELRLKQEKDALKDLTILLKAHNVGNRGPQAVQESTKEVIDGMMTSAKRHFIVFNIRQIQIALLAWRHHLNKNTTPSTQLSIFVRSTLEIYSTEEAKKAAKKLESKRHKRKDPSETPNAAEFERDVTKVFYDKATLVKLGNVMNADQGGTFHFEFGCAVFYPKPSDANSKIPKDIASAQNTPTQNKQAQEPAAEKSIEITTPVNATRNTMQRDFSGDIMQLDLRLTRIEAQLGVQKGTLFVESPSLVDRVVAIENELDTMRSTTMRPEEVPDKEPQSPGPLFEPDFMYQ